MVPVRKSLAITTLPFVGPSVPENASNEKMDRFLSDDERDRLTAIASIVRFKKGAKIYQEGDRTNEVFCIISGVVKTYKAPPDESEHITAFLFRDDVFGLSEEGRYTNSAKAIAEVTAYRLPISALRNRLLSDADLGWHVIRKLHQDLGQAQRHSFILTRKHALSRLAMFLQLRINE